MTQTKAKKPGRHSKMLEGKPIKESQGALTLVVTKRDVITSRRKDPEQCAIARCVIRTQPAIGVRVGKRIALLEYDDHFERYSVAAMTRTMVEGFDKTGTFVTGKYTLLPPAPSGRLTGKGKSKARQTKRGPSGPSGKHVSRYKSERNIYRAGAI